MMRSLAWLLMASSAVLFGCNKPMETIPAITPIPSSGTTDSSGTTGSGTTMGWDDGDHDHGDHEHAEHGDHEGHEHGPGEEHGEEHSAEGNDGSAEEGEDKEDSASLDSTGVRFVADTRLKVSNMMCPFSCYPKVKETLAAQPGVEGVQLVEQKDESAIDNPIVELKLGGDFDAEAAIAALSKVNFNAEVIN